ncbi:MAG TPA: hypothetical protein VMV37_11750 [Gammaproteobacteria bacterium]|nr:hypothetical protein [Gammaproteobacteria bacterium]
MRAVARLVWTYLTALPILRWVGASALASLPFAVLAMWPRARGFMVLPVIALAIHSLSMTIAAGYLFRVLSSPRSHRFLPHFRGRSLAAFLAILAIVSAPWLVIVAWAALRPPYAFTLVGPLFIMVMMVGFTFFPVGASVTFAALLLIAWLLTRVASAHPELFVASPVTLAVGLLAVWVAIWAAFSVWYLRVRRIEPIQPPAMILDKLGFRPPARAVVFDRRGAVAASLAAAYPQATRQSLVGLAVLLVGTKIATVVATSSHFVFTTPILVPALVIPGVLLAAVATTVARRARSLWLKSGLSRRALLAVTEKQIWRTAALRSIAVSVVLATGFALAYDVPAPMLARGLVTALTTAVLALYLGLALVRESRLMEVFTAALVIGSAAVALWAAFSAPARDGVWLATIVSQGAAALVCRAIAIAQWRRIDWLVFKPIRVLSQSLR